MIEMEYDNRPDRARLIRFVLFIVGLLIGFLLVSCAAPKEVVHTEYKDHYHTDTVQVVDSFYRYLLVREKGDTIYIHDSINRWRTKEKVVKEFIHDSIDRPVEVIKPKTRFEKAVYGSGYVLWGLIVIGIIIGIIKLLIRFHVL